MKLNEPNLTDTLGPSTAAAPRDSISPLLAAVDARVGSAASASVEAARFPVGGGSCMATTAHGGFAWGCMFPQGHSGPHRNTIGGGAWLGGIAPQQSYAYALDEIAALRADLTTERQARQAAEARLLEAEAGAAAMREVLVILAGPIECGCSPCVGQCRSQESLETHLDGLGDMATEALGSTAGRDMLELLDAARKDAAEKRTAWKDACARADAAEGRERVYLDALESAAEAQRQLLEMARVTGIGWAVMDATQLIRAALAEAPEHPPADPHAEHFDALLARLDETARDLDTVGGGIGLEGAAEHVRDAARIVREWLEADA